MYNINYIIIVHHFATYFLPLKRIKRNAIIVNLLLPNKCIGDKDYFGFI